MPEIKLVKSTQVVEQLKKIIDIPPNASKIVLTLGAGDVAKAEVTYFVTMKNSIEEVTESFVLIKA